MTPDTPPVVGLTMVATESGSTYEIDTAASTVSRVIVGADSNVLRRDGEPIDLVDMQPPTVGEAMRMLLNLRRDGILTVRWTSPVRSIWHPDATGRRAA